MCSCASVHDGVQHTGFCEWNRAGSVLSTMKQQWHQPSGRQTGPALRSTLCLMSSSRLKPLVFPLGRSEASTEATGSKETQGNFRLPPLLCLTGKLTKVLVRIQKSEGV